MRLAVAVAVSAIVSAAQAECVEVKYREGSCVPLERLRCEDVTRSSAIKRLCYDAAKSYLLVQFAPPVWYHHCGVPAREFDALRSASSIGGYYNANVRSKPDGSHGPYDCRDRPVPSY